MSAHKAKLLSAFSNASKLPPDQKYNDGRKYLWGSIHARLRALLKPIWVSEPARLEEDGEIWFSRSQRTHEGFWGRKKAGEVDLLLSTVVWTFSQASVKLNFAPSKACLWSGTTVRKLTLESSPRAHLEDLVGSTNESSAIATNFLQRAFPTNSRSRRKSRTFGYDT